ncbi:MAG TPA: NrfD/PsrC family molybdoenzyme membrane anchor subunit [Vicinamibacterales bacterium]|jgi:Fe-S-cluster-containing dehydrogenase component/formate-dependent nitrite reductase membrane component NrfD
MPTYGFAIDLRKCIGCHACTIACKAEHDIPVGVHRCWVKTVEKGTFPDTRRFFFPVLCNQCTDAPCVTICPTGALFKRRDGIVDLHGDRCIGCRACMEACPYDQLFIDPNTRTAEKCNFCANRVENKLLPACVSVCPTECRIFGDLDDPSSEVAQIAQREAFMVRKPEKGTGPRVLYLGAEDSAIRPESAARPLFYKEGQVHLRPIGAPDEDPAAPGAPRVDYDVPHPKPWGADMVLYLFMKAISTGAMLAAALLWLVGVRGALVTVVAPVMSIVFITLTAAVLVADLERPERFYYILTKSNWRSWMVWGSWLLAAHGLIGAIWLAAGWYGADAILAPLAWIAILVAVPATAYTGFLFAQGLGRDLWQGPYAAVDLIAQSGAAGSAALLIASAFTADGGARPVLCWLLAGSLAAHLLMLLFENVLSPSPTRHHELAVRTIRRGAYAPLFWALSIGAGGLVPLAALAIAGAAARGTVAVAALLALAGNAAWEYIWVEAGQSVPLS